MSKRRENLEVLTAWERGTGSRKKNMGSSRYFSVGTRAVSEASGTEYPEERLEQPLYSFKVQIDLPRGVEKGRKNELRIRREGTGGGRDYSRLKIKGERGAFLTSYPLEAVNILAAEYLSVWGRGRPLTGFLKKEGETVGKILRGRKYRRNCLGRKGSLEGRPSH